MTLVTFPLFCEDIIMKVAMQERRINPRRKMVLPVKISGGEGAGLAYTMDVTSAGARLGRGHRRLEADLHGAVQRRERRHASFEERRRGLTLSASRDGVRAAWGAWVPAH